MAYKFDENKYKKTFDSMYGSGTFDSELSNARKIGRLKAQAEFAKQAYKDRKTKEKEAEERRVKAENDNQVVYGDMPAYYSRGLQEKAKEQGRGGHQPTYENTLKEREAIKKGREKAAKEVVPDFSKLTEYQKQLRGITPSWDKKEPKKEKKKSGIGGFFDKLKKSEVGKAAKAAEDFFNPFDNVKAKDAVKNYMNSDKSDTFKEVARGANRTVDSASLGLMSNLDKKVNKREPYYNSQREWGEGKGTDMFTTGLGYLVPGAAAYKAANATKAGKALTDFGSKSLGKRLASEAAKGMGVGAGLSSAEVGVRESLNPKDQDWKDNAKYIGISTALGAVADPLLYGAGKGLKSLFKKSKPSANANEELLALPEPQLRLNEPQKQLPGPKEVEPTFDNFNKAFKQPNMSNPIPEAPKKSFQQKLDETGLGFARQGKYEPKPRVEIPNFKASDGDKALLGKQGDGILDNLSKLQSVPSGHYERRLLDVQKEMKSIMDRRPDYLPEMSIDDLYKRVRKDTDPESFDGLIKMNEREVSFNKNRPVQGPREGTLKDALKQDDRINDLIKKLHPSKRPEPTVSRLATFDEMVEKLKADAPTKKTGNELFPLPFVREKGFNPTKSVNIQNRSIEPQMSLAERLSVLGVKKNGGSSKPGRDFEPIAAAPKGTQTPKENPITKPQDEHEYGLIDTKAEARAKEQAEMDDLLANSENWKDKGKFFFGRETMKRNFEDVMGADASKVKEKILDPFEKSEAERIRFLNTEREAIKAHGIKPKSVDDKMVQMYGEKKISVAELKQKTPNWKKVVKVAESYRKKYDELLTTVNKVLVDNGFDPIPKRADYFPHYEEVDGLMKQFGFDMENHALPTDINGLTDTFKPTKAFFNNALRRKGDQTTFGAIEGADRYLEGISNLIYHTKNIKQLRALEKGIRTKHADSTHLNQFAAELGEYTNIIAGKKTKVDRVIEDRFGRTVYNVVDTLRRRTGANMIGANVASALTNFIPLTHSLSTTSKDAFVKGMMQTLNNVVKNDGFIQQSDFLTKRIGSDPLVRTLWDKSIDKSMWLMRTLDAFTSQTIVRGKYNELMKKGLPHQQAIKQADDWAARIIADRSKGGMPTLFNSKTFGIVSQFQLEVNNQVSFLFKDLPKNAESKAALASSVGQVLLYSYLFNNLYEKSIGRRPAFDPVGIAFQAEKDYTNDNISNSEATKRMSTNILNTLPFTSMINGGRVPIGASKPEIGKAMSGQADWTEELAKPLWYLGLPAGGGQIKKSLEGLTAMNSNPFSPQETTGVYQTEKDGDKVLKYPVEDSLQNKLKAGVFGKYSLPETKEFYDNRRRNLSAKQTQQVEQSKDPKQMYMQMMNQRRINTLKDKMKDVQKDSTLSPQERNTEILKLIKQMQELGG